MSVCRLMALTGSRHYARQWQHRHVQLSDSSHPVSSSAAGVRVARRSTWEGQDRLANRLWIGDRGLSTVEVAAPASAVSLGPELSLMLHQAPDPGAVGAEVGLDVGGRLMDGGPGEAGEAGA